MEYKVITDGLSEEEALQQHFAVLPAAIRARGGFEVAVCYGYRGSAGRLTVCTPLP